jgi:hypothetical protein
MYRLPKTGCLAARRDPQGEKMSGSLAAKSTPLEKRVSKKVKLGSRGGKH